MVLMTSFTPWYKHPPMLWFIPSLWFMELSNLLVKPVQIILYMIIFTHFNITVSLNNH